MGEDWIEFDEGDMMPRNTFSVSMSRIGEISYNRHTDEAMGHPEAVVLLYAPDQDKIGLRPASPLMPNAFTVKRKGSFGHRLVRARPFMLRHDLKIDGTVRFQSVTVENGILILDLRTMKLVRRLRADVSRRQENKFQASSNIVF